MALKVNFAHQISHKTQKIRSIFFYLLLDFDMKFKIKLSKNQKWPKHMFMKIKNPSVHTVVFLLEGVPSRVGINTEVFPQEGVLFPRRACPLIRACKSSMNLVLILTWLRPVPLSSSGSRWCAGWRHQHTRPHRPC